MNFNLPQDELANTQHLQQMTTYTSNRPLSKSKLVAFRQCSKRLWLEIHRPEMREDSSATQAVFRTGHEVGAVAQQVYDPANEGVVIDWKVEGIATALDRTSAVLEKRNSIFEAGFSAEGGLAFADILLPIADGQEPAWKMVEVKSSTKVKRYQEDDIAIQSHIARASGVNLHSVCIAHIDATWVYPGEGAYDGLLIEKDMTQVAIARSAEVTRWIADAHQIATLEEPPKISMGAQCSSPFVCGFQTHCSASLPAADYPINWLPHTPSTTFKDFLTKSNARDMREVPDTLLSPLQHRVRNASLSGQPYFDIEGAREDLRHYPLPAYFLDFETIQFGVPRWAGTRPFQMLPFQFSLHKLDTRGELTHRSFLDLSGNDPSETFAASLVGSCTEPLPIFVYNAGFEGVRLKELAQRFPAMATALLAIHSRLVDLLPITRARYYHPLQRGSWSIKQVLPTLTSNINYDALPGIRDGGMAMDAYIEAISPSTKPERKSAIHSELLAYCALDTLAMVEIWRYLSQSSPPHNLPITPDSLPTKEDTMSTQPESPTHTPFFAALMQHLIDGSMIPKVQVERSIGPVIGFFLADVLSTKLGEDVVMLCPEFPIRKEDNNQSTNIDWLMFSRTKQDLLLVELKTTDTSFRIGQANIYDVLQEAIASEQSAAFMIDDLECIGENSSEPGKYRTVKKMLATGLGTTENQLRDALDCCKSVRVIYLAPEASKPQDWRPDWTWLSFNDLPQALSAHPHADQWEAIRNSLLSLDTLTRRMRNGDIAPSVAGERNYKALLDFAQTVDVCRSNGASVVLGMMNWRSELPGMTLDQLQGRTYKYDAAEGGIGKKIGRNWIPGDQFLAHVMSLAATDSSHPLQPISTASPAMTEYTQIPIHSLVAGHWYVGKGRNADIGLWTGEHFLVLTQVGVKTGPGPQDWDMRWGVKTEPYFETDSGTFQPFKEVSMGAIGTPIGERDYAKTMVFGA